MEIVVFVATCRDFDEGRLTALICPTVGFYKGLLGSRMRVIHSEHPCRAFKGEIMGCSEIAFKDIGELGDGLEGEDSSSVVVLDYNDHGDVD